jgi:hypothetical protein
MPRSFRSVEQGGDRLVDLFHLAGEALHDVVVGAGSVEVPAVVEQLDVPHARLGHAAGEQAVVGERFLTRLRSVRFVDVLWFLRHVHHLGDGHLHAVGEFVLADPGFGFGIAEPFEFLLVQFADRVEAAAAHVAVHPLGFET